MSVIPMNQQGELSSKDMYLSSSRLVWCLNRDPIYSYKAKFQGEMIEIPPANQRIAKPTSQGGNLMPYLTACKFVRDLVEPQGYEMDSHGKPQPIFRNKMLHEEELTPDEYEKIIGNKGNALRDMKREEKEASRKLTQNLTKVANKVKVEDEDE